MLIVHLYVSYAHVNLCHFFCHSWCRGFSACGSSWTFLFTFLYFDVISNSFIYRTMLRISYEYWKHIIAVREEISHTGHGVIKIKMANDSNQARTQGLGAGVQMHPIAGQIISKACSFPPETEFTPLVLVLASKSDFSLDSHPPPHFFAKSLK